MLNVIKESKGNVCVIKMVGTIDEQTNLQDLIGEIPNEIHVNCKEVTRINSYGVRLWVEYFKKVSDKNVKMKFVDCSTTIVHQLNLMVNFIPPKAEIESICAPYLCEGCKTQFVTVFKMAVIPSFLGGTKVPSIKCPKCTNGTAVFDDLEEEYFSFAGRRK